MSDNQIVTLFWICIVHQETEQFKDFKTSWVFTSSWRKIVHDCLSETRKIYGLQDRIIEFNHIWIHVLQLCQGLPRLFDLYAPET